MYELSAKNDRLTCDRRPDRFRQFSDLILCRDVQLDIQISLCQPACRLVQFRDRFRQRICALVDTAHHHDNSHCKNDQEHTDRRKQHLIVFKERHVAEHQISCFSYQLYGTVFCGTVRFVFQKLGALVHDCIDHIVRNVHIRNVLLHQFRIWMIDEHSVRGNQPDVSVASDCITAQYLCHMIQRNIHSRSAKHIAAFIVYRRCRTQNNLSGAGIYVRFGQDCFPGLNAGIPCTPCNVPAVRGSVSVRLRNDARIQIRNPHRHHILAVRSCSIDEIFFHISHRFCT